jgi:hypothetical protein
MERARGESVGRTEAMGRGGALSCPECASARSGMAWASWARLGASSLVTSVRVSGQGRYQRALQGVVSLVDIVKGTREGWREGVAW